MQLFRIKQNGNGRALVQFAFHGDLAVVVLHGVLHDGQAQARAAGLLGVALIHAIEALKHLVLMLGSDADTGILHTQQHFTFFLRNGYFHAAAGGVVLNSIVAEVVNDLVQQSADTIDNTLIAGDFQRNIFQLCRIGKGLTDLWKKMNSNQKHSCFYYFLKYLLW